MMTSFRRGLVLGSAVLGSLALATLHSAAQATTNTTGAGQLPPPLLDHDEMVQLNNARQAVFKTHPELEAENEKLKAMHDSTQTPTAEQRNATFAEWQAYQKKMRAEMLKVDPGLKQVFAKIDAARKNGAPPPFQPAPAK